MKNRVMMGLAAAALLAGGWFLGSGVSAQDSAEPAIAPCIAPRWTIHDGEGPIFLLDTETGDNWVWTGSRLQGSWLQMSR